LTLFQYRLDPKHDIQAIKYFTALVSGKRDPNKPLRQKIFLRALQKYIPLTTESDDMNLPEKKKRQSFIVTGLTNLPPVLL
jgi:hypothetical protein